MLKDEGSQCRNIEAISYGRVEAHEDMGHVIFVVRACSVDLVLMEASSILLQTSNAPRRGEICALTGRIPRQRL